MRRIERSSRFKRDYKRIVASATGDSLASDLASVVTALASDLPLPTRNRDHALTGEWKGFRDCHVRPDVVLIYRKVGLDLLELARLGSHSDLF
jgi:mRNA interferase YafQ